MCVQKLRVCRFKLIFSATNIRQNFRGTETHQRAAALPHALKTKEANMPLILLWVGIPVLLVGGGYVIVHAMH